MSRVSIALWAAFAVFVGVALWHGQAERPFAFEGKLWGAKLAVWIVLAAFTAFSLNCSRHEELLDTIKKLNQLHWGRQIGLDLYIGLTLSLLVIGLHAGSPWVALVWMPALYLFGNLATLLWFAIHFDGLVARFA